MGKKRKVAGGEDGELAKEAAAPKVLAAAADERTFPNTCFPGCQAGGEEVDHRVGGGAPRVLQNRQGVLPPQH